MRKFALITGASGGIGEATARVLASEGWNLYLHYYSNSEKITKLVEELAIYNIEIIPIRANLMDEQGPLELIKSIFQIDAIVYASGTAPYGLFTDLDGETLNRTLQLHVQSPMVLIQTLLPRLMRNKQAQIVMISSIWGQTGAACEVLYSTTKGAQIAFVKALSKETASSGVRVNCVAPGAVQTNMLDGFTKEELAGIESEIPMGRLADPSEIADVISFLLSEKSSYITGQVLGVNGGWYM